MRLCGVHFFGGRSSAPEYVEDSVRPSVRASARPPQYSNQLMTSQCPNEHSLTHSPAPFLLPPPFAIIYLPSVDFGHEKGGDADVMAVAKCIHDAMVVEN